MSTVLDPPDCTTAIRAADRLRTTMAAVRVSLSWLGVRKTLTAEQKVHAAESFAQRPNSSRPERSCSIRVTPPSRQ